MTAALAPAVGGNATTSPQRHGRLALLLLSPTFIVLALVIVYPLVSAIRESLYQRQEGLDENGFIVQGNKFVGIDNYSAIFTGETATRVWTAFYNTTFFTVIGVSIEVVLGVAMALVMHYALRGKGLVRASILVPWAVPTAMSAILWQWIFQANGVANEILGSQILWTTEGFQAKIAVLIADTWKTAPFIGLLTLAGLQIISGEVYEAARVDGAGVPTQFFRITLPLCRPALAALATLQVTWIYNEFYWATVLMQSGDKFPITSSLNNLRGQFFTDYNLLSAGSILVAIPVLVVFFLLQKQFVAGLTLGATKG